MGDKSFRVSIDRIDTLSGSEWEIGVVSLQTDQHIVMILDSQCARLVERISKGVKPEAIPVIQIDCDQPVQIRVRDHGVVTI
ncbi:hypothetical protein JXA47_13250, partial [Candidatus Sumerlaeota bacterium]|nr:hypothetical protein [Candidatus Sumerlaeota bacterium]